MTRFNAAVLLILLGVAPAVGYCDVTPTVAPAPVAAMPASITGVGNFAQVSPTVYRGEQPTAAGFAELKKRGIRTVVSLRNFHDDRDLLKGTGLQYVRINSNAWHPEEEDLVEFLKVVSDPANQPVFVHCLHGADRTGYMVASYRMIEQGWTSQQALEELNRFNFHSVWTMIPKALRDLNSQAVRAKLSTAVAPQIAVIQ